MLLIERIVLMRSFALPGFVLAAAAAVLWGTAGTAQTFISSPTLSPLWVGALRIVCASFFFYPMLFIERAKSKVGSSIFDEHKGAATGRGAFALKVLAAGIAMALFNLLFFTGVKMAGVALGSCTIIGSAPVWAGLLDAVVRKKTPDRLWIVGVALAIAGGVWMAVSQAENVAVNGVGLAICLAAGFFYAGYSMLAKELVAVATPVKATTLAFSVAGVIAIGAAFAFSETPEFRPADLLVVAYLGLFTTGVAYLLYGTALKTTRVSTCVALGLLEPVTAFVLAVTVVGENVNPWATVGLAAILAGLVVVLKSEQLERLRALATEEKEAKAALEPEKKTNGATKKNAQALADAA